MTDRALDWIRAQGERAVGAAPVVREAALAVSRAGAVSRALSRRATSDRSGAARRTAPPTSIRSCAPIARTTNALSFAREEVARHVRPAYMGLIAQVDHHVGRVLDALDGAGPDAGHADRLHLGPRRVHRRPRAGREGALLRRDRARAVHRRAIPIARADATRGTAEARFVEGDRRRADDPRGAGHPRGAAPDRGALAPAACARRGRRRVARRGVRRARLRIPAGAPGARSRGAASAARFMVAHRAIGSTCTGRASGRSYFDLAARSGRVRTTSARTRASPRDRGAARAATFRLARDAQAPDDRVGRRRSSAAPTPTARTASTSASGDGGCGATVGSVRRQRRRRWRVTKWYVNASAPADERASRLVSGQSA